MVTVIVKVIVTVTVTVMVKVTAIETVTVTVTSRLHDSNVIFTVPLINLNASFKQTLFKVYSAINIPKKLFEGLYEHNINLQMNSNVLIEEEEFVTRVKDCDAIIFSSFGHVIDKCCDIDVAVVLEQKVSWELLI